MKKLLMTFIQLKINLFENCFENSKIENSKI